MSTETVNVKSGTVVRACSCKHDYQDGKYGAGKRVHNIGAKHVTCTVCGSKK